MAAEERISVLRVAPRESALPDFGRVRIGGWSRSGWNRRARDERQGWMFYRLRDTGFSDGFRGRAA